MTEREALSILGLSVRPAQWAVVQKAFKEKIRAAQSRVQFPGPGISRESALDELDRVKQALDVLHFAMSPFPRKARPAAVSPGPAPPPISKLPDVVQMLIAFWKVLRRYLPKLWSAAVLAMQCVWASLKTSWSKTRAAAVYIANVISPYTKLLTRMTRATPRKAVAGAVAATIMISLIFGAYHMLTASSVTPTSYVGFNTDAYPADVPEHLYSAALTPFGELDPLAELLLEEERRQMAYLDLSAPSSRGPNPSNLMSPYQDTERRESRNERDGQESSVLRFFTWPPSKVYVNGQFLIEAPSPQGVTIDAGNHTLRCRTDVGLEHVVQVHLESNRDYEYTFNFETNQESLKTLSP